MPIYEYVCTACHHSFEVRQRFSDDPVRACPECGGAVRRLLFPAGIIFKGSGFYSTDYRRSSSTNGHESTASSATTAAGATSDED